MLRIHFMYPRPPIHAFVSRQSQVNLPARATCHLHSALLNNLTAIQPLLLLFLRKEVIQPHLPIRLPCYDFTPVIRPAFDGSFPLLSTTVIASYDLHRSFYDFHRSFLRPRDIFLSSIVKLRFTITTYVVLTRG